MTRARKILGAATFVAAVAGTGCGVTAEDKREAAAVTVRIALFNIRELTTEKLLELDPWGRGNNNQARAAAQIIQRVRPDILVLNEIDHDYANLDQGLDLNARRFRDLYLSDGATELDLRFSFAAGNNTGILSGVDLDGDGHTASDADRGERRHGNDSFGYGTYAGEYSMAVLSRFPILSDEARTFQHFLWKDLPGAHLPEGVLSPQALEVYRLSSKSHWDLPVEVGGRVLHLFVSHPTPQGFDGEEDKNGRRNFDEIKLWTEYLDDGASLVDDEGVAGGYGSSEPFVIAGDLNAAPLVEGWEGDGSFRISVYDGMAAIEQLLGHPRIQDSGPFVTSRGALAHGSQALRAAGAPRYFERSTSVFGEGARIDYLLPSTKLEIVAGGVFWPTVEDDAEGASWAEEASDHRLVWLDVRIGSSADSSDAGAR